MNQDPPLLHDTEMFKNRNFPLLIQCWLSYTGQCMLLDHSHLHLYTSMSPTFPGTHQTSLDLEMSVGLHDFLQK